MILVSYMIFKFKHHLESPEVDFFWDIPGIFQPEVTVYDSDDLLHIYVIYQVYTCHMKTERIYLVS